jgi:hypothetical protein
MGEAVTEAEWLTCIDPQKMLEFLRGKASDRKLRLFAVAAFGRIAWLLPDPRQRRGIEVLEELAEGAASRIETRRMTAEVRQAIPADDWVSGNPPTDSPYYVALMLYREFCSSSIATHAVAATAGLADSARELHKQVELLRCIFGNPFRPSPPIPQGVLAWNDGTIPRIAQAIYDERGFDRMPILADALEEAGCTNPDILTHFRGPGEHVRGCWVVDLLLGKER